MKRKLIVLLTLAAALISGCSNLEAADEETASEITFVKEERTDAAVAADSNSSQRQTEAEPVTVESGIAMQHVHGLGVSGDGTEVYVPAHAGLKIYKSGRWTETSGALHDYMGFSMVDDGFYSSGHPGEESDLADPFGIVRSVDMGESLVLLDLYEEVDFHLMSAGYYSHVIYAVNPKPNSRMEEAGIYYSTNDAQTWKKSGGEGLKGQLVTIDVHPDDEAIVAIGTDRGVFVSVNHGQDFKAVTDAPVSAIAFSPQGNLLAASESDSPGLQVIDLKTKKGSVLPLPDLAEGNDINHLAVNPENDGNVVFSTIESDIYISEDSGTSWTKIAHKGNALDLKQ
ncbi:F510_1955 family glycosylhydrolase [Planococcus lenghuensis]|uniref:Beta-barrel assembly machine subunit BamC n=1 Tax=Planococcus lenghuensis TaxID=2213202 RepID=A0A1Q2KXW2_9BACL|nr:hypothetical protein [Planococcus lenghuensis]AQQ52647.1 hypothetical protein B0X71_05735 [Planococcus lenghuensis]